MNLLIYWLDIIDLLLDLMELNLFQSVTNFFIANLALADVIIGLFAIPFQFQAALLQRWNLPDFMCPFCPFFQVNYNFEAEIQFLPPLAHRGGFIFLYNFIFKGNLK